MMVIAGIITETCLNLNLKIFPSGESREDGNIARAASEIPEKNIFLRNFFTFSYRQISKWPKCEISKSQKTNDK